MSVFKSCNLSVQQSRGEFNRLAHKFSPTKANADAKLALITIHQH